MEQPGTGPSTTGVSARASVTPPMPAELGEALRFLGEADPDFDAIVAFVERQAAIAARLVALANSAWSAPAREITSIEAACARLGTRTVRNTVIALTVRSAFQTDACPLFDAERCWSRGLLTAELGALIAEAVQAGPEAVQTVRTLGLLRNIGVQWLAHAEPEATDAAFELAALEPEMGLSESLRLHCGMGVAEASAFLLRAWKLPESMCDSIERSAIPTQSPDPDAAELLGHANWLAKLVERADEEPVDADLVVAVTGIAALGDEAFQHAATRAVIDAAQLAEALFPGRNRH